MNKVAQAFPADVIFILSDLFSDESCFLLVEMMDFTAAVISSFCVVDPSLILCTETQA